VRDSGTDEPGHPAPSGDAQLDRALRSMHADPGRRWTLDRLAREAGVSRSVFAERFRERIGTTPMRFLGDLRMRLARRLLADRGLGAGEVGRRVGYASEAAFNRAFRAALGEPPGRYRRGRPGRGAARRLPVSRARTPDAGESPPCT